MEAIKNSIKSAENSTQLLELLEQNIEDIKSEDHFLLGLYDKLSQEAIHFLDTHTSMFKRTKMRNLRGLTIPIYQVNPATSKSFFKVCFYLMVLMSTVSGQGCNHSSIIDLKPLKMAKIETESLLNHTKPLMAWTKDNLNCFNSRMFFDHLSTDDISDLNRISSNSSDYLAIDVQSNGGINFDFFLHQGCKYSYKPRFQSYLELTKNIKISKFKMLFPGNCLISYKLTNLDILQQHVSPAAHIFGCYHLCIGNKKCSYFEYNFTSQLCSLLSGNGTKSNIKTNNIISGHKNCEPFYQNKEVQVMVDKKLENAFNKCSFSPPPMQNKIQYSCKDLSSYLSSKITNHIGVIESFKQYLQQRVGLSKTASLTHFMGILNSLEKIPHFFKHKSALFEGINNNQEKIKKVILNMVNRILSSSSPKKSLGQPKLISASLTNNEQSLKQIFRINEGYCKPILKNVEVLPANVSEPIVDQGIWSDLLDIIYKHDGIQYLLIICLVCIQLIFCCIKAYCKPKDLTSDSYTSLKIDVEPKDPHATPEFLNSIQFTGP